MKDHGHGRHRGHYHADMLSVEEAFDRIISVFRPLDAEYKPILEALGQVLSEDVYSPLDIPPAANSAMDGYALRHGDLKGASAGSPVTLKVIGLIAAGQVPSQSVEPGTAIRIMTGAPVPEGCDTIVPFEETDEVDRKAQGRALDEVNVLVEQPQGTHIRPAGRTLSGVRRSSTRGPSSARRR